MIKLSVSIICYNQEKYIEQTLQGAISQETNFEYEVVVGDDHSTDGTSQLIQNVAKQYPNKVRLLKRNNNIGAIRNAIDTNSNCRGEYVALLEGDDYWIDKYKLQKQVDYLDSHPESVLCFTDVCEMDESRRRDDLIARPKCVKQYYNLEDVLVANFIPTCTTVIRHKREMKHPEWITKLKQCDWSYCVMLGAHGTYGYIPETTAVRRIHGAGIWSGMSKEMELQSMLESYRCFDEYLNGNHRILLHKLITSVELLLAVDYEKQGRYRESLRIMKKILPSLLLNQYAEKYELLKLLAKYCLFFRPRH
jgi:glycosyltransferase involved in cell wall biosynthesis